MVPVYDPVEILVTTSVANVPTGWGWVDVGSVPPWPTPATCFAIPAFVGT